MATVGGDRSEPAQPRRAPLSARVIPFGKFLLLDRIAIGGMAELYIAKSFGIEGFEKLVAIKRILPTMEEDHEFIEMFVDEAKIAGQLTHANIVPIYELGMYGGAHYMAMELVWGKDLLQIMNRFRRMRQRMPPPMVAWIAAKMCDALDYAHNKRDQGGTRLNLIHRDISPQNILVSYEGHVKLIDFGIARAASRRTRTQAGILKGKFGYMSPEQVRGMPIDGRSDLFAVGTCMYEMATSDRLFLGESDFATLERVRTARVAMLSTVAPGVPPLFERIVMRALSGERESRYQTAAELRDDLTHYLEQSDPPFDTGTLSDWLKSAFAGEMAEEKGKLESFALVTQKGPGTEPNRSDVPRPDETRPLRALTHLRPSTAPGSVDNDDDPTSEFPNLEVDATQVSAEVALPDGGLADQPTQIFFTAEQWAAQMAGALPDLPGAFPMAVPPQALEPSFLPPNAQPSVAPLGGLRAVHAGGNGAPVLGVVHVSPAATMEVSTPSATMSMPRTAPWSRGRLAFLAVVVGLFLAALGAGLAWMVERTRPATLIVRAVPEIHAGVRVDGVPRGRTPLTIEQVPTGARRVEVAADGYVPVSQTVELDPGATAVFDVPMRELGEARMEPARPPVVSPVDPVPPPINPIVLPVPPPEGSQVAPDSNRVGQVEQGKRPSDDSAARREERRQRRLDRERERRERREREQALREEARRAREARVQQARMETQVAQNTTESGTPVSDAGQGTVSINTVPVSRVSVDGRDLGMTPLLRVRLAVGRHQFVFRTGDGVAHVRSVEVRGGPDVQRVGVDLAREAPPGAPEQP